MIVANQPPMGRSDIAALTDLIISDIFDNHRGFLPGAGGRPADVRQQLEGPILLDGLGEEEALLILSILPRTASQIWLAPMDKGLSGAKVLRARYSDEAGRFSKQFVVKVDIARKIDREADAVERLCSPYLPGIEFPVRRRGSHLGLIAQELRGLSIHANVESLRNYIRSTRTGSKIIARLVRERLAPWYEPGIQGGLHPIKLGKLLDPYLAKGASSSIFPPEWSDLQDWVEEICQVPWREPGDQVAVMRERSIDVPLSISHGDLHSQNVLVDSTSRECWPIDFAWCRDDGSLVVDLVMLEVSLKNLSIPMQADLREMLRLEWQLCNSYQGVRVPSNMPYATVVKSVLEGVQEVRRFAEESGISFDHYRSCLCLMTLAHAAHPKLNRPLVLGATQMMLGLEQ
ncbi:hypothetical protein [Amycolatopsis sp. RTGN1]|uniref:hypothetical protein n=1 Tax=Amycolatopsis ponsaeliensis TaxID=2992142 RepID=UPI0025508281|nr:hypothetical protein [Amycolatopsis sp. RTGN1]